MTNITDEWGDVYTPIDGWSLKTRNDFTLAEFEEALSTASDYDYEDDNEENVARGVEFLYPERDDVDKDGYSLTEKYPNGGRKYFGRRYGKNSGLEPVGYRYITLEDFSYEGGIIGGFGHFESVTSGNLGDGHDAWALFKHVESGRLFLNTGWYSSYDSGEMDTWTEVEPAEVKVIRYQDINTKKIFDNPAVTVE